MDFGNLCPTAEELTTGEPSHKHRAIMGPSGEQRRTGAQNQKQAEDELKRMEALLTLVAKLSLSNALGSRILKSIVLLTYLVPAECPFVTKAKEATQNYSTKAEAIAKDQRQQILGLPHAHVWNAMVLAASSVLKDAALARLNEYVENVLKPQGLQGILLQVKYARVNKCYDKSLRRIEVNFLAGSPAEAVWKDMETAVLSNPKAKKCEGLAPASSLERKIQKIIDSSRTE